MSNLQLYLAIGLPVVANAAMFLLFQSNTHRLLDAFRSGIDARFDSSRHGAEGLRQNIEGLQALLRVEQVMDARLRLLEQQR